MKIGIDIDDTITETSKEINKQIKKLQVLKKVAKDINVRDKLLQLIGKKGITNIHHNIKVRYGVKSFFKKAKEQGHKIILITARGGILPNGENQNFLIAVTKRFLKKHHLQVDKVIYAQKTKAEACLKEKIDIFIDDREMILDEIKEQGIRTICFGQVKDVISKHQIVYSWLELEKLLLK